MQESQRFGSDFIQQHSRPIMHLMNAGWAFPELRVAVRLHPVRRDRKLSCVKRHRPCTNGTMEIILQAILVVGVERSPIVLYPQIPGVVGVSPELQTDLVTSGVLARCR